MSESGQILKNMEKMMSMLQNILDRFDEVGTEVVEVDPSQVVESKLVEVDLLPVDESEVIEVDLSPFAKQQVEVSTEVLPSHPPVITLLDDVGYVAEDDCVKPINVPLSYVVENALSLCVVGVCENASKTIISNFYPICCSPDGMRWLSGGLSHLTSSWFEEPPPMPPDISGFINIHQGFWYEDFLEVRYSMDKLVCLDHASLTKGKVTKQRSDTT